MFGHDNQNDNNHDSDQHQPNVPPNDGVLGAPPLDDNTMSASGDDNTMSAPSDDHASDNHHGADDGAMGGFLPSTSEPLPAVKPAAYGDTGSDDLLDIKQEALHELTPLIDHLEQTPEEKFRTTMMMIQAADNQALIKTAYETAKQIKSDKERAQALLDIVNEINYFTQHSLPTAA